MSPFVQKFIQNHIQLIEDNEWEKVFNAWYLECKEIWPDQKEFIEFLAALQVSGILVDLRARKDILKNEFISEIEYIMTHQDEWAGSKQFVSNMYLVNELDSHLGYTSDELLEIIEEVAKLLNLKPTPGGWNWYE